MGFLGAIKKGLKSGWKAISGILVKFPVPAPVDELAELRERTDAFSKARVDLMDKYGMTKVEATEAARDIAFMPEANMPDEYIDTWRIMYPERG